MTPEEQVELLRSKRSPHVVGVAIALCCHHLCTWESYVNREWILDHGFSASEFNLICRMSAWATCRPTGPLGDARLKLGCACKAFLDNGRAAFLRDRGFDAEIREYCAEE